MSLQEKVVGKMYDNDAFSQWLGIEVVEVKDGYCELKMTVRKEMLNGFQIAHGGIAYSLADSALAFTSISHTVSVKKDDILTTTSKELSLSSKIGVYLITLTNQDNQEIAFFKGTVHRTFREWFSEDE